MKQLFDLGTQGEYAGIGSRKITARISRIKIEFACCMALKGLKVNSGAADGSDTSYETGAKIAYDEMCKRYPSRYTYGQYRHVMNVFLPWPGFNGRRGGKFAGYIEDVNPGAELITKNFHGNWEYLGQGARKMMSRNAMQALSFDLNSPVRFVSAYTDDGAKKSYDTSDKTGGTGQAIRIADHYDIPVYNMGNTKDLDKVTRWISEYSDFCLAQHGFDPRVLVDDYLKSFTGIKERAEGDLVIMASKGEVDILLHGANCMNAMGSGIAKQIREFYPEAYHADQATRKGSRNKLGTYSEASVITESGKPLTIINAYTQHSWGREDKLYSDYEAIRKSMRLINANYPGKKVGLPRIGTGLANGCWVTISNIIKTELKNMDVLLVDLPDGYEPVMKIKKSAPQASFDF